MKTGAEKLLVVVDQYRRDHIISKRLTEYCGKKNIEVIETTAFTALLDFLIYRPKFVLVGNADTYHSLYVRIISKFAVVASLPTEQVLNVKPSLLKKAWEQYLFEGHGGLQTAYNELDIMFSWGSESQGIFKELLRDKSIRVEPVGPIRLSQNNSLNVKRNSIGFLLDSFQDFLAMHLSSNDMKFHGFLGKHEYFILAKIMEANFYSNIKLIREAFPDTKLIFRKRFAEYSHEEQTRIKGFLDKYAINYEMDSTSDLQYLHDNCFAVIFSVTTAAAELQIGGIPAINVSSTSESTIYDREVVENYIHSTRPYDFAWFPRQSSELLNLIEGASKQEIDVSPDMELVNFYAEKVLGIGLGLPAKNILDTFYEERQRLENKDYSFFENEVVDLAVKFRLLPLPFSSAFYIKLINLDNIWTRLFWRASRYLLLKARAGRRLFRHLFIK